MSERGSERWSDLLRAHLPLHARLAGRDTIEELAARLLRVAPSAASPGEQLGGLLAALVEAHTDLLAAEVAAVRHSRAIETAPSEEGRRAAIREILVEQGGAALAVDLAAVDRSLDAEAIQDRDLLRTHSLGQAVEILAVVVTGLLLKSGSSPSVATPQLWDDVTRAAAAIAIHRGRLLPLRAAAVHLVAALVWRMPVPVPTSAARQTLLEMLADIHDDPFVLAAALESYVHLCRREGRTATDLLELAARPAPATWPHLPRDHLFLRARAVRLCGEAGRFDVLERVLTTPDPSEHVRLAAVRALGASDSPEALSVLTALAQGQLDEKSWVVRAAGLVVAMNPVDEDGQLTPPIHPPPTWLALVRAGLLGETEPRVVDVVLDALWDRRAALTPCATLARQMLQEPLTSWRARSGRSDVAEKATLLLRLLAVLCDPKRSAALADIEPWLATADAGSRRDFRSGPVAELNAEEMLSVLEVANADRTDLSASRRKPGVVRAGGWRIHVDAPPTVQPWRMVYELLHPAPDKRQAFRHVTDRIWPGQVVALTRRMAEVTPTRVPGQRVATPTRLSWRSELPLPGLFVAAARHKELLVSTPFERLVLTRQRSRPLAALAAQARYAKLAALRAQLQRRDEPDAIPRFDDAASRAGYQVKRGGAAFGIFPLDVEAVLADAARIDSNTVGQLAATALVLTGLWIARSMFDARQTNRHRKTVPLVIGGWGSRGKSGTERLKAGLFHGLGYRVLSKTTGCEAMIIASTPGKGPSEIFLFRPFDKATIWEHRGVIGMAADMKAQVMLWECMALNPEYVELLQDGWTRDSFSTLTNTYPDHEDIQGPSGRDVAEVIGRFIPEGAVAFSSEQHMTPVLRQSARHKGSKLTVLRPEEWTLLPEDVLKRFPYSEHPRNIALVVKLAGHLGVPADLALKLMADHVVPDLGVLKEYGPVPYRGRSITFVNGCSANERAGFMSNWERMGLDAHDEDAGLEGRLVIVVNNRADRLPRQLVFQQIMLQDVAADAICVIGTNVGSFAQGYRDGLAHAVKKELLELAASSRTRFFAEANLRLRRRPFNRVAADAAVTRFAGAQLGQQKVAELVEKAYGGSQHVDAVSRALVVIKPLSDVTFEMDLESAVAQWLRETSWLWLLEQQIETFHVGAAVDGLLAVLAARLRPLTDAGLSGDQVVHRVATTAPPGSKTRILGCQNIKGTGLDFVYRWISADRTLPLLGALERSDGAAARLAMKKLGEHKDWGYMDAVVAKERLDAVLHSGHLRLFDLHEDARRLSLKVAAIASHREAALAGAGDKSLAVQAGHAAEMFVDPFDSVSRRRRADALFDDLVSRRVGQERAALIAKDLTSRQKGGWLVK